MRKSSATLSYLISLASFVSLAAGYGALNWPRDFSQPFCAMVWRDNLFATQFHPEKSQAEGLKILRNFASL